MLRKRVEHLEQEVRELWHGLNLGRYEQQMQSLSKENELLKKENEELKKSKQK